MKRKTVLIIFILILLIALFICPVKTKYEWLIDGKLVWTNNGIPSHPNGSEYNICKCNIFGVTLSKTHYKVEPLGEGLVY